MALSMAVAAPAPALVISIRTGCLLRCSFGFASASGALAVVSALFFVSCLCCVCCLCSRCSRGACVVLAWCSRGARAGLLIAVWFRLTRAGGQWQLSGGALPPACSGTLWVCGSWLLAFGSWLSAFGSRLSALGSRLLAFGSWPSALGSWPSALAACLAPFAPCLVPFALRLSPFASRLSPLAYRLWPMAYGLRPHVSCVLRCGSRSESFGAVRLGIFGRVCGQPVCRKVSISKALSVRWGFSSPWGDLSGTAWIRWRQPRRKWGEKKGRGRSFSRNFRLAVPGARGARLRRHTAGVVVLRAWARSTIGSARDF